MVTLTAHELLAVVATAFASGLMFGFGIAYLRVGGRR